MDSDQYLTFRDLSGKDHTLGKKLYKGMETNTKGQIWVLFGKSKIEICRCEFRRIFLKGFLGENYLTEK